MKAVKCQGYGAHADKGSMKWLTDIIHILFPTGQRIKVDPDHLPGLRPPRSASRTPVPPPETVRPTPSDIDGIYARFVKAGGHKTKKKQDRGVGF